MQRRVKGTPFWLPYNWRTFLWGTKRTLSWWQRMEDGTWEFKHVVFNWSWRADLARLINRLL